MSFMQAQVIHGEFHQLDTRYEGIVSVPAKYFDPASLADQYKGDVADVETVTGWFARLSAPGYMDCTEWSGPFATEEEAREHLIEMYGDDDDSEEIN